MIKADEKADVKELVFGNAQVGENASLRREGKGRSCRSEVKGSDEFIHTRIQQGIGGAEKSMYVSLWMTL